MRRLADEFDLEAAVGQTALGVARFLGLKFRIDDVPVGDDQGRAVLDLQDHSRADAHAAQQTGADRGFHQGVGADAAGDGGRHVVQGVGIGLELIQAEGEMTAAAIVDGEKNNPGHGIGQTEQNAGYGEPRAALAGMMNSAQGQAAQKDGNQPRHHTKQRDPGQSDNHRGDRQARPAARFQGDLSGGIAGIVRGRHDHRPRWGLDPGDFVDGDPQFRLTVLAEDPSGRGTVERSAAVVGVPADNVMDRAATQAGHDFLAVGDGRRAVRAAGTGLTVPGSSVRNRAIQPT